MTSRERVIKTLEFKGPDRLPVDLWVLPSASEKYGSDLDTLIARHDLDIQQYTGPCDVSFDKRIYEPGEFVDVWQSRWKNHQSGIIGEVKDPVLKTAQDMMTYTPPIDYFQQEWQRYLPELNRQIAQSRQNDKFIIGGWINFFERMQFLRGTEDLYCDLFDLEEPVYCLRDKLRDFYLAYLDRWLDLDIDAIAIGDDWGSQRSLLISPDLWRRFFKPIYKEFCDKALAKGKYIFFHSDGYILELYEEFIELGVKAINSQLWCMGVETVAERFAGRITFWGEISRQDTLPMGTPIEVREAAGQMKKLLFVNGGGLIGQSEVGRDVPFSNIEAVLTAWNELSPEMV